MSKRKLDLESLRKKLLAQRDELLQTEQTGDEAAATVELDQTRVGRLSRMDAMQAQAMSIESKRRRQVKLRQIESALKRINNDDYGECKDCGEEIATGRIEYDPAATLCITCASAQTQR
ncbi:MAG: TraR/DksA C4-type zinc finger protein [Gammaproteobacteria bacterium]|nr:TraR/DksA C4-type zinc finger protein [Gammaproteobacteria bacterium]NNF66139.1 TraR/DksA family transcriptional regulator [Gammaproteobacteria bacterium]